MGEKIKIYENPKESQDQNGKTNKKSGERETPDIIKFEEHPIVQKRRFPEEVREIVKKRKGKSKKPNRIK